MIEIYETQVCFLPDTPFAIRQKNDCAIIMVAAIAEIPYEAASRVLRACGKKDDDGATDSQWKTALRRLGCDVRRVRTVRKTVRTVTRALPTTTRYVIVTTDHVVAYVDGELIDDTQWGDLLRVSDVYQVDFLDFPCLDGML